MQREAGRPDRLEIGAARPGGVEGLEALSRGDEPRRRAASPSGAELDLRLEQLTVGALQFVEWPFPRHLQQRGRGIRSPGGVCRASGHERALRAARRVWRQGHGALEERCRRREAAASLRAPGRGVELGRNRLVRPRAGVGPVPCAPVAVSCGRDGLGERRMRPPAIGRRGVAVDGGAHQGMAEAHALVDRHQLIGARERLFDVQARALRGLGEERRIAGRLGRGDEEKPLRGARHLLHATGKGLLDPGGHERGPAHARESEAARQLSGVPAARQLEQRQRVAGRLGDDAIAYALVQRPCDHRPQQGSCVVVAQTLDDELRQVLHLAVCGRQAGREDDRDRLGDQPARNEPEDLGRRPVEPLRVVDQADERPFLGGFAYEVEHRQAHQEAIRHIAGPQAERRSQRVTLRREQPIEPVQ